MSDSESSTEGSALEVQPVQRTTTFSDLTPETRQMIIRLQKVQVTLHEEMIPLEVKVEGLRQKYAKLSSMNANKLIVKDVESNLVTAEQVLYDIEDCLRAWKPLDQKVMNALYDESRVELSDEEEAKLDAIFEEYEDLIARIRELE